MATSGKQYGLLVPKKAGQNLQPRHSVFGDDSESDSGESGNWIGKSFKNESVQKRQTKLDIQKALEQDPTVYQYDEVYDEMEEKKLEQKNKQKDPERKPKYIQSLLATAERRKREQERRTERKVQKEREAEGEEFKDKESFVTAAYRKKLEEFQAMDEQERLQDKIEELNDVSKQKDLGGFYRHLFRQTVGDDGDDDKVGSESVQVKDEKDTKKYHSDEENKPEEQEINDNFQETSELKSLGKVEERSYRKRKVSSSSESDNGQSDVGKKTKALEGSDGDTDTSSSDSSSDSSNDSSSSSSGDEEEAVKVKETENDTVKKKVSDTEEMSEDNKKHSDSSSRKVNGIVDLNESDVLDDASGNNLTNEKCPEEPKPNIWEKKTVGPVFDAALQRYLSRKAARMANSLT